jgi:hypothetical protein
MTSNPTPITAEELVDMVGELDGQTAAHVLALEPTVAEVAEALDAIEDELADGRPTHVSSSAKVVELREIFADLALDPDPGLDRHEYAVMV